MLTFKTCKHNTNMRLQLCKTKLVCIDASITSIKKKLNAQKWKTWTRCHCLCQRKLSKICILLSKLKKHLCKLTFITHHIMCSSISFCCCNHFNSMFMNVRLIMMQLQLNDIGCKLVFHSYSKFTSNTWYTLICKFEEYKPKPKKLHWYEHI
jgi:hypothetical protein